MIYFYYVHLQLVEDKLRIFNTISIKLLVYRYLQNNAIILHNISHKKYFLQLIRV